MLSQRMIESFVGMFVLAAMMALLVLAFKVSGLTSFFKPESFTVSAAFDEIGQLKVRSPVKMGGVVIGEVSTITLDPQTYRAIVKMDIYRRYNEIPDDSSANILTAGLLGDNYIALTPMYSPSFLKNGSVIEDTHSAMILEKMIGQLIYKISNPTNPEAKTSSVSTSASTPVSSSPAKIQTSSHINTQKRIQK